MSPLPTQLAKARREGRAPAIAESSPAGDAGQLQKNEARVQNRVGFQSARLGSYRAGLIGQKNAGRTRAVIRVYLFLTAWQLAAPRRTLRRPAR